MKNYTKKLGPYLEDELLINYNFIESLEAFETMGVLTASFIYNVIDDPDATKPHLRDSVIVQYYANTTNLSKKYTVLNPYGADPYIITLAEDYFREQIFKACGKIAKSECLSLVILSIRFDVY